MSDDLDLDELDSILKEAEAKYVPGSTSGAVKDAADKTNTSGGAAANSYGMHGTADPAGGGMKQDGKTNSAGKKPLSFLSNDDLDFLEELDKECDIPGQKTTTRNPTNYADRAEEDSCTAAAEKVPRKCFPIMLGGSDDTMGYNSRHPVKCCDNMMCIKCDFKIVSIDNHAWHKDCDYLFFRNYSPEIPALKKKASFQKVFTELATKVEKAAFSPLK